MSERFPNIDWYCDRCNAYLNSQNGFDDHNYTHTCGDYSSTIQKRLIVFAHIPLKTKLFMFKTDIANYRNKELKDEIIVRLGFWM